MSIDHGRWPFFDKDTLPLQAVRAGATACASCPAGRRSATARTSAAASSACRRCTSTSAPGWATARWSTRTRWWARARRSGERVPHQRGGADRRRARAGGRAAGHHRGRRAGRRQLRHLRGGGGEARAPCSRPAPILTGSTPVYDLPNALHHPGRGRRSRWSSPRGPSSCPGARAVTVGRGQGVGPVARHAGDREVPRREDRHPHGAGSDGSARRGRPGARARGHRLDDRTRGRGRARCWRGTCRDAGLAGAASAGGRGDASTSSPRCASGRAVVPSRRISIACRRSSRAALEGDRLYGRGSCDAKGILAAQVAAAERLRAHRARRRRAALRRGRGARQRGRRRRQRRVRCRRGYLINGEPTDNRLGDGHARRAPRAADARRGARRTRRTRSWASRRSRSSWMRSCGCAASSWPADPSSATPSTRSGVIDGRRGAQRRAAARAGRKCCSAPSARRRRAARLGPARARWWRGARARACRP